jgi:serine/threonine protein kinase
MEAMGKKADLDGLAPTMAVAGGKTGGGGAFLPTMPASGLDLTDDYAGHEPTVDRGASSLPRIAEGTKFAKYEIIRSIGEGGMGQVWLARDTRLGRRVAIKFVREARKGAAAARFLDEARITARCSHENIVVIHEVDALDGWPYMVLEHLEGLTLRELARQRQLSWGHAVELVLPVVRALACAHEFGIVHRDLKPENIFVTRSGVVKVLDFGIAKPLEEADGPRARISALDLLESGGTGAGARVGTPPYMSPEQLLGLEVDHRTDFYALGIILWELITGEHPIQPLTAQALLASANALDTPMPRLAAADVPGLLAESVARCLAKPRDARYPAATAILTDLAKVSSVRGSGPLDAVEPEAPYPGLAAFQEADAARFFGRAQDVTSVTAQLIERPMIAIVGPSGVGKSSFVRAGLIPALRRQGGRRWAVHSLRPGRRPLTALLNALGVSTPPPSSSASGGWLAPDVLRREPGRFGERLREDAARTGGQLLLVVDQLEELFTLVEDADERRAFIACLRGAADDHSSPIRVVLSIRSDFVDRLGEHGETLDDVMRSLVFLQPLGRAGLHEALEQPLVRFGYRFESDAIVNEMLDVLAHTPGALPLLQFAATRLWEDRDHNAKLLTLKSYRAMGGISGALTSHADAVLASLSADGRDLARALFTRLVTPERTRAVVEIDELSGLSPSAAELQQLIDRLVAARLLVAQRHGTAGAVTVELIHEVLIGGWPTLRRWLDESAEDAPFLAQLRAAARQWEQKERPRGLLWSGETADEARSFRRRYRGTLSAEERSFLDAVIGHRDRAARVRRGVVAATIALLGALVAVGAIALVRIHSAEQNAIDAKERAENEATRAQAEAQRARTAEQRAKDQYELLRVEQTQRAEAQREARAARQDVVAKDEDLRTTNQRLTLALEEAELEKKRAQQARTLSEQAAQDAKRERERAENLLRAEQERNARLESRMKRISTGTLE